MKLQRIHLPKTDSDLAYNLFQSSFDVYRDQNHSHFAVMRKTHRLIRAEKNELCTIIRNLYFQKVGSILSCKRVHETCATITAQMQLCDDERIVAYRFYFDGKSLYYDLGDKAVEINRDGVTLISKKALPFFFTEGKCFRAQASPSRNASARSLLKAMAEFFYLDKENLLLLCIYIISSFLPQINHPVLFLHGTQGAAKSTALRMIKRIIDPNDKDVFTLPKKDDDLVSVLGNNYFVPFDNISYISAGFSDVLCQAVTNGSVSKRRLYTDNDEMVVNLHSVVAISGIEMTISRMDLLDRSITLQLERIPEKKRKTEQELWQHFDSLMPMIIGAVFDALSCAIAMFPQITLPNNFRMADFAKWGYCIAEALCKGGGKTFLAAYRNNIHSSVDSLVGSHPLLFAINLFMENQRVWKGTPSNLLANLRDVYVSNSLNESLPYQFPNNAIVLSKQLALMSNDLQSLGITVGFGRGKERFIILER